VVQSLSAQHFDNDQLAYSYRLLALVKFFINKNQPLVAHYLLKKAEDCAKETDNPELHDLIYSEFIRLSRELDTVNPDHYIKKRKENAGQLAHLRQIDDILGAVTYRLKVTQNYSSGTAPVLKALEKTVDDFAADKIIIKNPVARFKIYNAVSQVLLQKHKYKHLEDYLLKTYKEFLQDNLFSKNNHDSKLQMLTYIVNTLYKTGKLKQSLQFAEELHTAMKEYNNMLYDKFIFYYHHSLVINYSQLDKNKAITILEELGENKKINKNNFYQRFIYLNLFLQWFDLKDFHKAAKSLTKLYLIDDYYNTDLLFQLKVTMADIMLRYELKDYDTMASKLKQTRKLFKELFFHPECMNEKEFLQILDVFCDMGKKGKPMPFYHIAKDFLEKKVKKEDDLDTELISYRNWLKEKTHILDE
jgi:hypothetical protein